MSDAGTNRMAGRPCGARRRPRVVFAALAWLAPLALVPGAPLQAQPIASPADAPVIGWRPERPNEGELFLVRVEPPVGRDVVLIVGEAAGEPLHFERAADGSFESLAAVPLGARASVPIELSTFFADGEEEVAERTVPITPGVYNHRRLTVAPELGSPPTPEQQARRDREAAMAAEVSENAHRTRRLWSGEVVLPKPVERVTSGFGDGRIFNGQVSSQHTGLDIDGVTGDTVYAPARGVVELTGQFELAGNNVYINHGSGLVSAYFHLSEQLVAVGDTVEVGMPIGRVGATGRVTGPHLHWVVRYGHISVDPRSLIAISQRD
jgi:murein DD-endopeptidase MepM/ murein hydrolase activator NlpD